jgi:hypothetical protein
METVNPKHKKEGENNSKGDHNQIIQNSGYRENIKNSQGKKEIYTKKQREE